MYRETEETKSTVLLRPLFVIFFSLVVITGLLYPFTMTGIAKIAFPKQAAGSLIYREGRLVGSRWIGQANENPAYFWGRLSANHYDASNSGGSNLASSNPDLRKAAEVRIAALREADPGNLALIPVDLVTASASGLDPAISPAAAEYQVSRVARLRHLDPQVVRAMVGKHTQHRAFGIIGEPAVNVLELNLELANQKSE